MGTGGIKRRKRKRPLRRVSANIENTNGPHPWTPMGIVDGYGKFARAAHSPYPEQRRRFRILVYGALSFCGGIVLLALLFGR